jgi:type IV pilus assembly protein PilV
MKKSVEGVMLLEALIGILIFSIGILGLVGLQSASIKNMTEARYRSEAAYLVNQIVGRMWSDRTNLASYALTTATTCTSGTSTLQNWLCQVETNLPGISATANRPEVVIAGDQVTVTLRWQLPGADARRYVVVTRIN